MLCIDVYVCFDSMSVLAFMEGVYTVCLPMNLSDVTAYIVMVNQTSMLCLYHIAAEVKLLSSPYRYNTLSHLQV